MEEVPFLECLGTKLEVKPASFGNSENKALESCLCWPGLFFRGSRRFSQPDLLSSSLTESSGLGKVVSGNAHPGGSWHLTSVRMKASSGIFNNYRISRMNFTMGTKLLEFQVQVMLLDASVIIISGHVCFCFKWYSWSHLVLTISEPQHTVHKPPIATTPSLSSLTSEI